MAREQAEQHTVLNGPHPGAPEQAFETTTTTAQTSTTAGSGSTVAGEATTSTVSYTHLTLPTSDLV